jgi:hypothetical protein
MSATTMTIADRLHALCEELNAVEEQITPLQAERDRIRAELSLLVTTQGNKVKLDGFGRLEVSQASMHVSYDRKQIEHVILKLVDAGHYHIADALRSCKKESARPGTLRVMRDLR